MRRRIDLIPGFTRRLPGASGLAAAAAVAGDPAPLLELQATGRRPPHASALPRTRSPRAKRRRSRAS